MGFVEDYEYHLRQLWPDVVATTGWKTRGNGFNWAEGKPIGMMNHHLVVPGTPGYEMTSVNMIINGHASLSGPLANIMTAFDGTIYLVAGKPANHAGKGGSSVRNKSRNEIAPAGDAANVGVVDDMIGNNWYWGNECQHPGDSSAWPDIQIRAVYAANAAFCRAKGCNNPNCCIHHREWTPRKIDMSWRGNLRAGTQQVLNGGDWFPDRITKAEWVSALREAAPRRG